MESIIHYFQTSSHEYWSYFSQHIAISAAALLISLVIALPLGYWGSKNRAIAEFCQAFAQVLRIVPSLALLFFLIPIMGTGLAPALIALIVLALPPLLINTILGFSEVSKEMEGVGLALGMTNWQLLKEVQLPQALPYLLNGIKLALIEIISSATLATYIGAGGLGTLIFTGLALYRMDLVFIGGLSVAFLSLISMIGFDLLIRKATTHDSNY